MNSIMSIIHALRVLCHSYRITPENIKITVEFLNPKDQHAAECAVRSSTLDAIMGADPKLIEGVCQGRDFTVMGFKFAVKRYEYQQPPTREWCNCPDCERRRAAARR